jgi:hypothetical protein
MALSGEANENRSVYRLRWVGYGLLLFALVDAISILASVPGMMADPTWIIQVIGQFVERSVVPLLGFALIFFGEAYDRRPSEKIGVQLLSWLCIVLAAVYFLMIPPVIVQSIQVRGQAVATIDQRVDEQAKVGFERLAQAEKQLPTAKPEELVQMANGLRQVGIEVNANPSDTEKLRREIGAGIKTFKEKANVQLEQAKNMAKQNAQGQTTSLLKNAIKWALGALITAVLFGYLWKSSRWSL